MNLRLICALCALALAACATRHSTKPVANNSTKNSTVATSAAPATSSTTEQLASKATLTPAEESKDLAAIKSAFGLEPWLDFVEYRIVDRYENIYAVHVLGKKAGGIYFFKKLNDGNFLHLKTKLPENILLAAEREQYKIPADEALRIIAQGCKYSKFTPQGELMLYLYVYMFKDQDEEDIYYVNKYKIAVQGAELKISTLSIGTVYNRLQFDRLRESLQ